MASTRRSNTRKASQAATSPEALDKGAVLLSLARIMAQLTPRAAEPEREYVNGFFGGFEHGLELANLDPAAAEMWRQWLTTVLHRNRADNAAALTLHAKRLAEKAPPP